MRWGVVTDIIGVYSDPSPRSISRKLCIEKTSMLAASKRLTLLWRLSPHKTLQLRLEQRRNILDPIGELFYDENLVVNVRQHVETPATL